VRCAAVGGYETVPVSVPADVVTEAVIVAEPVSSD
jgi:hypothetical protein